MRRILASRYASVDFSFHVFCCDPSECCETKVKKEEPTKSGGKRREK